MSVKEVPSNLSPEMEDFWGGYRIEFKIIEKAKHVKLKDKLRSLRTQAKPLGERGSPKFRIDVSKHEYCGDKISRLFDDYTIVTYSPRMVVCEKLRAICQQMPEYVAVVKSHPSARARDFLDLYTVIESAT